MPIYEYECTKCHHKLDLIQKMNDPPAQQCPHCLQDGLIRLISAAGFQLKGTGWYVTDFKNKNEPTKKNGSISDAKAHAQPSSDKPTESSSVATKKKEGESN